MQNVQLISFKESLFAKTNRKDLKFMDSPSLSRLAKLNSPFLLFSDFPVLERNIEFIRDLHKLEKFLGMVLNVDSELYTLSSQVIEKMATKSTITKIRPVSDIAAITRVIHAWKIGAQEDLIAEFKVDDNGYFYLLGCNLEMHWGHFSKLGVFKENELKRFKQFEIDKHGSYLHWKSGDIHLDLTSIKAALDSEFKDKLLVEGVRANKDFGRKMKKVREQYKYSQGDFKGLSDKQIRRYEQGDAFPTMKALKTISESLKMTVDEYVSAVKNVA